MAGFVNFKKETYVISNPLLMFKRNYLVVFGSSKIGLLRHNFNCLALQKNLTYQNLIMLI